MTVMTQIILAVALVLSIIVPFGYYFIGEKSRGRYKTTIATNAFFFFGTMLVAAMVMFAGSSSVQAATGADAGIATGLGYIAAALVTGSFLYWWWYCRSQCGKCSSWCNQRGSEHSW